MKPRVSETGRALVGLLCVNLGLLGVLGFLLVSNRSSEQRLRERLEEMDRTCAALTSRQEQLVEEGARSRLELAEAKDAAKKADDLLSESRAEAARLRADLDRVRAERDEHLSVRLSLERKLEDALDLLASRRD